MSARVRARRTAWLRRCVALALLGPGACAVRVDVTTSPPGSEQPFYLELPGPRPVLVLREYLGAESGQPAQRSDVLAEAFLKVLRSSGAFPEAYIEPPRDPGAKIFELRLTEAYKVDAERGRNALRWWASRLSLYTLLPLLPQTYELGSAMLLEVRGDGRTLQLRSEAVAAAYSRLEPARALPYSTQAAAAELRRRNWNQLTRELVQALGVR